MAPSLVLFCGIPGSGKTTIATELAGKLPGSIFVQTDRIRAMLAKPKYTGVESRFVYSSLISVGEKALASGFDTLLEGTFPREEFRKEALDSLSPLAGMSLVVYVFCPPELAFGRNAGREQAVPWESFLRIYNQFEAPRDALRLDSASLSADDAAKKILSVLKR